MSPLLNGVNVLPNFGILRSHGKYTQIRHNYRAGVQTWSAPGRFGARRAPPRRSAPRVRCARSGSVRSSALHPSTPRRSGIDSELTLHAMPYTSEFCSVIERSPQQPDNVARLTFIFFCSWSASRASNAHFDVHLATNPAAGDRSLWRGFHRPGTFIQRDAIASIEVWVA